jgi:outer membrane protein assembly factor BamB
VATLAAAAAAGLAGAVAVPGTGAQEPAATDPPPIRARRPGGGPVAAATPAAPRFVAPRLLWKTFLRRCDSTPAVDDGVIFTGAGSYLYALDNGGRTLWAAETGNQQSSPALGDNDRVYIGSDRGVVYAANRRGGQIAWRFTAGNTILTRPAVGGGRVYAESTDNNVYALDAARGTLRWKFTRPDGSLGYSSPVYTRDGLFVCGESTLYCLDPASGKENWRAPLGGRSLSTPAVGGRRVFVGGEGGDAGISAVSTDGKPLWSFAGKAGRRLVRGAALRRRHGLRVDLPALRVCARRRHRQAALGSPPPRKRARGAGAGRRTRRAVCHLGDVPRQPDPDGAGPAHRASSVELPRRLSE